MLYPDDAMEQRRTPLGNDDDCLKQPAGLFAHAPGTVPVRSAAGSGPGKSVTRSLFQHATGLFRKRPAFSPAPEVVVRRREPVAVEPAQIAQAGELVMEAERPIERRSTALDESGLDIPAFLRRQSSSA